MVFLGRKSHILEKLALFDPLVIKFWTKKIRILESYICTRLYVLKIMVFSNWDRRINVQFQIVDIDRKSCNLYPNLLLYFYVRLFKI